MKILQVVPTYLPATRYGGPIYSVHGLSRALVAAGHEVHVATTNVDGPGVSPVALEGPVILDGVLVHYFPASFRRLYYAPRMARFFKRELASYEVVHLHSVFLWPTSRAARCAYKRDVPYVLSPRGMLVRSLMRAKSPWLKRAWVACIEARTIARANALHLTTEVEREDFQALDLHARRVAVIPNGVEPAGNGVDHPLIKQLSEPYLLFIGRIDWKKGLQHVVQALAKLPGWHLVVAGPDDQGLLQPMLEQARRWAKRIHYVGSVGEEKWSLYRHARALVLPSLSENFANVVVEAAQMGCPAILSPQVGLAAEWQRGGAAIVCQPQAEAVAEAVKQLQPRHAAMAAAATQLWPNYRWPSVADAMAALYRDL